MERGGLEEINGAIDDNFVKMRFRGEDGLDGAAGGEFEAGGEAVAVKFGGSNPAEAGGGGVGENNCAEGGATGGREALGIVQGEIGVAQSRVLGVKKSGAENNGANDKWSGPGTATNFVNTED